jgi:uncharacterized protein
VTRTRLLAFALLSAFAVTALALRGGGVQGESALPEYREIAWIDLLPDGDFEALMNPPAWIDEVEEGSEADRMDPELFRDDPHSLRYLEALRSEEVVEAWLREPVRIPGFVVPLEFDDRQRVTEFFLVPYFGACIHLPPPPPNQMIHVRLPEGIPLPRLEDAVWIEGMLGASVTAHEIGTSAYALDGHSVQPYGYVPD